MQTFPHTRSADGQLMLRRPTRWAAAPTLLMALANVPIGLSQGDSDLPAGVAWLVTILGLVGLVAGIGLLRRVSWAGPLLAVVGAINVVGGAAVLVLQDDGAGVVGIVLGFAAVVLALVPARRSRGTAQATIG